MCIARSFSLASALASAALVVLLLHPLFPAETRELGDSLAPYVPSPMEVVKKMLEMAEVQAADVVYDLGCGDGRIVVAAAKEYGARGVGVDFDPERVKESRQLAKDEKVEDRVEFRQGDAKLVDLQPATVVALYLLTESNRQLKPLLEKLRPGARVVCHNYEIPGWTAVRSEQVKDSRGWPHMIYLYRIDASADLTGAWSWTEYAGLPLGGKKDGPTPRRTSLLLIQDGEKLTGALRSGTGPRSAWTETPIEDGRVKGGELTFTAALPRAGQPATFTFKGTREGDLIRFIKEAEGFVEKWGARRERVEPTGTWSWMLPAPGGPARTLEIRPAAAGLSGLLDRKSSVEGLSVQGARIRFEVALPLADGKQSAGKHSFRGVIDGDEIRGTVKDPTGTELSFQAARVADPGGEKSGAGARK